MNKLFAFLAIAVSLFIRSCVFFKISAGDKYDQSVTDTKKDIILDVTKPLELYMPKGGWGPNDRIHITAKKIKLCDQDILSLMTGKWSCKLDNEMLNLLSQDISLLTIYSHETGKVFFQMPIEFNDKKSKSLAVSRPNNNKSYDAKKRKSIISKAQFVTSIGLMSLASGFSIFKIFEVFTKTQPNINVNKIIPKGVTPPPPPHTSTPSPPRPKPSRPRPPAATPPKPSPPPSSPKPKPIAPPPKSSPPPSLPKSKPYAPPKPPNLPKAKPTAPSPKPPSPPSPPPSLPKARPSTAKNIHPSKSMEDTIIPSSTTPNFNFNFKNPFQNSTSTSSPTGVNASSLRLHFKMANVKTGGILGAASGLVFLGSLFTFRRPTLSSSDSGFMHQSSLTSPRGVNFKRPSYSYTSTQRENSLFTKFQDMRAQHQVWAKSLDNYYHTVQSNTKARSSAIWNTLGRMKQQQQQQRSDAFKKEQFALQKPLNEARSKISTSAAIKTTKHMSNQLTNTFDSSSKSKTSKTVISTQVKIKQQNNWLQTLKNKSPAFSFSLDIPQKQKEAYSDILKNFESMKVNQKQQQQKWLESMNQKLSVQYSVPQTTSLEFSNLLDKVFPAYLAISLPVVVFSKFRDFNFFKNPFFSLKAMKESGIEKVSNVKFELQKIGSLIINLSKRFSKLAEKTARQAKALQTKSPKKNKGGFENRIKTDFL